MDRITITVRNNGSLFISGDDMAKVRLVDHEGNEISTEGRKAISLCRCGGSTKKPFCDGTHSKIGFQGAIAAQQTFDLARAAGAPVPAAGEAALAAAAAVGTSAVGTATTSTTSTTSAAPADIPAGGTPGTTPNG